MPTAQQLGKQPNFDKIQLETKGITSGLLGKNHKIYMGLFPDVMPFLRRTFSKCMTAVILTWQLRLKEFLGLQKKSCHPKLLFFMVIKVEFLFACRSRSIAFYGFFLHNSEVPQLSTTTTLFMLSAMFIYSGERELLNVIIKLELQMVLNLSHIFQINKNKKQKTKTTTNQQSGLQYY